MDLIILASPTYRQRDTAFRACLRGAEKFLPHDRLFVCGLGPKDSIQWLHNATVTYGRKAPLSDLAYLAELMVQIPDLSDQFIVMDDHTVLRSDFPLEEMDVCNAGRVRIKRENDSVVKAISYLLEDNRQTIDYETELPVVLDKRLLTKLLLNLPHTDFSLRMIYKNIYPEGLALKILHPHIDQWTHSMDPKAPWLHFDDVALEHEMCLKWLERQLPEKSKYER